MHTAPGACLPYGPGAYLTWNILQDYRGQNIKKAFNKCGPYIFSDIELMGGGGSEYHFFVFWRWNLPQPN